MLSMTAMLALTEAAGEGSTDELAGLLGGVFRIGIAFAGGAVWAPGGDALLMRIDSSTVTVSARYGSDTDGAETWRPPVTRFG